MELMLPGSRKAAFKMETYVVLSAVHYKKRCSLFTVYYIRQSQRNTFGLGVHDTVSSTYQYWYFFISTGSIVPDALCQQSMGSVSALA